MRLKFYLIGLGIGIIVTAVVMGIALRGRTREMSDDEVMARARQLGMVEASTLTELSGSANNEQDTQLTPPDGQSPAASEQTTQNQTGALIAGNTADGETIANGDGNGNSAGTAGSGDAEGGDGDGAPGEGNEAGSEDGRAGSGDSPLVVTGEPDDGEADAAAGGAAQEDSAQAQTPGGGTGDPAGAPVQEDAPDAEASDGSPANGAGSGRSGAASGVRGSGNGNNTNNTNNTNSSDNGNGASEASASPDQPVTGSIVVTIPDGVGSEEICELLQSAGVIDSAVAFNNFLVESDRDRFISTGARLIPRGATYEEVGFIISGR